MPLKTLQVTWVMGYVLVGQRQLGYVCRSLTFCPSLLSYVFKTFTSNSFEDQRCYKVQAQLQVCR